MALDQSVLSELADALKSSDGIDLVREAVRLVLQELIESELSSAIGAGLYERTEARTNERNGHRPRVVSTKAGDISLGIPKLRKGSFFPSTPRAPPSHLSTLPLFPSRKFTEFPTGLRLLFYSTTAAFARATPRGSWLS